jgi:hypothetical protein
MPVNVRTDKSGQGRRPHYRPQHDPSNGTDRRSPDLGADEHTLCAAAAIWWLYCRGRPAAERAVSNHVLITTIAATILPHLMKCILRRSDPTGVASRRICTALLFQGALSSPFRPATPFISVHLPPLPLSSRDNSALSPGRRVRFWLLLEFFSLRTGRATSRRV